MKKNFKISVILFLFCLFFSTSLFAIPLENIKEYTLENGLTVFILQDSSTPLIRVEYTTRAGFSNQTKETSGFFKLYTRLFQNSAQTQNISFDYAECNADSSRYIITTVPSNLENTLLVLSKTAFDLSFSNEQLSAEFSLLKSEVKEEASSAGGFINASIDSRVFSGSPWKHDSGVYPAILNKTSTEKARNILETISSRYYTPQNSAVFISGNINAENILSLIMKTFGHYYSSYSVPQSKKSIPVNNQRKFVIHSPDFSKDMTQIVMQYTVLSMEECDLAAEMLNNDNSFFKYNLVNLPSLNIPGNEYINAASAHKKDSSRLIIQSLLQKSEDKKSTVTSLDQAKLFIETTLSGIKDTNFMEFYIAQQNAISNMTLINSSSTDFMDNLSSYWALQPYDSFIEDILDENETSTTAQSLFSRSYKLGEIQFETILSKLNADSPFIFVIINSDDFKKNKSKYTAAGFEEVNTTNGAWYNQKFYNNYADSEETLFSLENLYSASEQNNSLTYTNDFYTENLKLIKQSTLTNGIPCITKYNENSSDITILLSIKGGKLFSANDNGYEEVMINLLSTNIQKEILRQQQEAIILGTPIIECNTNLTSSTITVECAPYDFSACCKSISNAIIYGEILPSQADRAVTNRQYKKRLENGSVATQMLAAAIKEIYPKTDLPKVFEAKNEVLTNTSYQKILEGYPALLDASRYSVILTGIFPEDYEASLNSTLGLLNSSNTKIEYSFPKTTLKGNSKKTVKLTHTFLTDIPAEKAGPMPSKLIPTTEFLDPVIYIFTTPQAGTKENAVMDAALKYLAQIMQKNISKNSKISNAKAQADDFRATTDIATFTILNVSNQKEIDAAFRASVIELTDSLNSDSANDIIRNIKNNWINTTMQQTLSNTGTALLLQKGIEYLPYNQNPEYYLNEYNFIENATREDFINILEFIPQQPALRFYAK